MGVARRSKQEWMLEREQIANRKKALGASGNGLQFTMHLCLDMDTPRNVFLPYEEICADLQRGRDELDADKVIISGGGGLSAPTLCRVDRLCPLDWL